MTTLEKLYSIIANAADCNVTLGDDVYRQIAEMEESIIANEVVPVIRDTIAPILGQIKRELTLVVDYKPGNPVNVLISRKGRVYKEGDFVQISLNKPAPAQNQTPKAATRPKVKVISPLNTADDLDEEKPLHRVYGPNQKQYERKAPTTRLRVIRSDGSIIEEASAAQTMVAAIKEAGYENVHNLGLKNNNVPLVDYTKDSVYGKSQVEIERGVFVITHSATKRKQEHLQNISDSLRLGWKVEIVTK